MNLAETLQLHKKLFKTAGKQSVSLELPKVKKISSSFPYVTSNVHFGGNLSPPSTIAPAFIGSSTPPAINYPSLPPGIPTAKNTSSYSLAEDESFNLRKLPANMTEVL